jgi:hypothetical protein
MPSPPRTPDATFWEALHRIAQAEEAQVRGAMLDVIAQLQAAIDLDKVEALINGALGADWAGGRIMQAMGLDKIIYDGITAENATWERIAVAVGESSADALEQTLAIPEINMNRYFERVGQIARYESGQLITNLKGDQLSSIRAVLAENWQRTPRQLAESVRAVAGLQQRQALALERYRLKLEGQKKPKLSPSKIRAKVASERTRLSKIRGNAIARTETVRCANAAQLELWKVEKEAGHLSGIDLTKKFSGSEGELDYPPAHPNCLCAVLIIQLPDGRFARQWIRVPVQQECDICDSYQNQVI